MSVPSGSIFVDADGSIHSQGHVTLSNWLRALSGQVRGFLTQIRSCPRSADGSYLLRDAKLGVLNGPRVIWSRVTMLATSIQAQMLVSSESFQQAHAAMKKADAAGFCGEFGPPLNGIPLSETLRQIVILNPPAQPDAWRTGIPKQDIKRLSALLKQIGEHQRSAERNELAAQAKAPKLEPKDSEASHQSAEDVRRLAAALRSIPDKGDSPADCGSQAGRYVMTAIAKGAFSTGDRVHWADKIRQRFDDQNDLSAFGQAVDLAADELGIKLSLQSPPPDDRIPKEAFSAVAWVLDSEAARMDGKALPLPVAEAERGWTKTQLTREAVPEVSVGTFDRIRRKAGVTPGKKHTKGHRYTRIELERMFQAAPMAAPDRYREVQKAWRVILDAKKH